MATHRKFLPISTGVLALVAMAAILAPAVAKPAPSWSPQVCGMVISAAEQALGIPSQLLAAIARAESGRWLPERQANFAWPWTVTAEGEGRYYETKAEAIAAVKRLKARGVSNIDVGCLQINLQYHPGAFRNLEAAFDPMENTIYAAILLKSLYEGGRTWTSAVALYHSANPSARAPYIDKVSRLWREEHRRKVLTEQDALRRRLVAMATPRETESTE